jgi:hypothetical protein
MFLLQYGSKKFDEESLKLAVIQHKKRKNSGPLRPEVPKLLHLAPPFKILL